MADDTNTAERDALGFFLEKRGDVWVVQFKEGGCRPATIPEKALWHAAFQAGRASLAASAGSEPVAADPMLLKFYGVSTDSELIAAQTAHIERLQAKLPQAPSFAPQLVREG